MKTILLIAALAITTAGSAQTLDQRHANQQQRIDRGENNGQITPGEAGRLDAQQNRIDTAEARMRANHGGHLTGRERQRLRNRENIASRTIYDKAHNGHRD